MIHLTDIFTPLNPYTHKREIFTFWKLITIAILMIVNGFLGNTARDIRIYISPLVQI